MGGKKITFWHVKADGGHLIRCDTTIIRLLPILFVYLSWQILKKKQDWERICTSKAISILLARKISVQTVCVIPFRLSGSYSSPFFFFTVRKNDLKYWFNWLGGISWISRWSLGKADFIHRLNTSRYVLVFCFVFFGTCASTKSLISSSFRIFRFVLFSRRQNSTSYFPYIMYNTKKNTDWTCENIRLPVVQYGKNNVRSHVLNGCFWLDWNYGCIISQNITVPNITTETYTKYNNWYYYIRLYFTVFLLARSNTRDIPFSNIPGID